MRIKTASRGGYQIGGKGLPTATPILAIMASALSRSSGFVGDKLLPPAADAL